MQRLLQGLKEGLMVALPTAGLCAILDPLSRLGFSVFRAQYLAVVLSILGALVFVSDSVSQRSSLIGRLCSFMLATAIITGGVYVAIFYPKLLLTVGLVSPVRVVMGLLMVISLLEAARRTVGWAFVIIALVFIAYALLASWVPGPFRGKSVPFGSLMVFLYLDPQGIYGVPFEIAATVVLSFVLFGRFISAIGIGGLFSELANGIMGRFRGGPAKVSVFSSMLFGMISGSAVANVVTTGAFTIPTMIRAGYPPYFAAAVESVSSTGGQIMPPVMGAAAFLMATFLGIPYFKIALSAFLPAFLYYLSVFTQVDFRAARMGLRGLPREMIPRARVLLKDRWFLLIPPLVLVILLFGGWEVEYTGLLSSVACIAIGLILRKKLRFSGKGILTALKDSSGVMIEVGITSAAAGIIIGVLTVTGLGYTFASILVELASGSKFILLLLAAITSAILGMGMTVTAAYLLTVVLAAPALVEMGMDPLVAHFFVFYYAVLSFLTPPVCLAVYAASGLANSKMVTTAFQAMRLGIVAYIVPFVVAYHPALLLKGGPVSVLSYVMPAVLGIFFLSAGLEGYLLAALGPWKRAVMALSGVLLFVPSIEANVVGALCGVPVVALELAKKRLERRSP